MSVLFVIFSAQILRSGDDETTQARTIVREIRVENVGSGLVDESFVLVHVGTKVGDSFDGRRVSRDIRNLMDTEIFSYADVRAEPLSDGVRVIYSVEKKQKLAQPVVIKGMKHFSEKRIRNWLDLNQGDLVDDQVMGVKTLKVIREYRKDHYSLAAIDCEIKTIDREEGLCSVTLSVNEGRKAKLKDVLFEGADEGRIGTLRKLVKRYPVWDIRRLFQKRRYSDTDLALARTEIRDYYRNRGFLDVTVSQPEKEIGEDGRLLITFSVDEGLEYRFGQVSLQGVTIFPESAFKDALGRIEEGEIASAEKIKTAGQVIEDIFGSAGYIETSVDPVIHTTRESGAADITFVVREGNLASIRNIFIDGNTRTKDVVIRRELLVVPGDVYDEVRVRRSELRLRNLGYFSGVRRYHLNTSIPEQKDLVFEVDEQPTGRFMLGVGFSSIDKAMGYVEFFQGNFDIKHPWNFTGGGQKLKLRAEFGSRRKNYELLIVEPWFLDRRLRLGLDLYRSEVDYSDYDVERTGGAISLGAPVFRTVKGEIKYRLERVGLRDFADTNEYFTAEGDSYFFNREEDRTSSTIHLGLTHDMRNSSFFPTDGTLVSVFGRVSGGVLGCDSDVYGAGFNLRRYEPLWYNHVLSFNVRYETVDSYGDTEEVPITEKLFAGGGRTLRGFDYRDVGPKATRTVTLSDGTEDIYHRPIGGRSRALATVEYLIPIIPQIWLDCFYDTGNVWEDVYEFESSDLASSAGVGLRFNIPGFPIRIDRGWIIDKDDEMTDDDAWTVWIGADF